MEGICLRIFEGILIRNMCKVLGVIRIRIASACLGRSCRRCIQRVCGWRQTRPTSLSNHTIATHFVNAYDITVAYSTYMGPLSALSPLVPLSLVAEYFYSTWRTEVLREPEENVDLDSYAYGVQYQPL